MESIARIPQPRHVSAEPDRTPRGKRGSNRLALQRLSAREQFRAGRKPRRILQLLVGLVGYGAAIMVLVLSGLGAASWSVLSDGLARTLGLSFGWATDAVALVVLLAWIPMRELPGLGTVLNVVIVGWAADLTALVVPLPKTVGLQYTYLAGSIVAIAFFDALYLGAQFGSGPRDGLMTGLVRLTGRPVAVVRTGIEILVAATGWALGGRVGAGTVLLALTMGPLVGVLLPRLAVHLTSPTDPHRPPPLSTHNRQGPDVRP